MGTPAFRDLGRHCSVNECQLIEFLPFNCDRCNQVFCLQHKSYTKHYCPVANLIDVDVLICPLCAQGVRLHPNEDPNITWDVHVNCECDPSNYENAAQKKYCPFLGCKEILLFSNTIRCKDCTQEHCLRHKFAPDHKCSGPKKPDIGFPFIGILRRNLSSDLKHFQSPNISVKWRSNLRNSASSIRASAEASIQRISVATSQALQKAKDGMAMGRDGDGELVEKCLQCQARFSDVISLIDHVKKAHEHTLHPDCDAPFDVFPERGETLRDSVLMVKHVEVHGDSTRNLRG